MTPQFITPLQKRVDTITQDCQSTTQRAEALARNLAARDLVIQQLRDSLQLFMLGEGWRRHCFICGAKGHCGHREVDLVERWEAGELR
jgi:hypothetical protein